MKKKSTLPMMYCMSVISVLTIIPSLIYEVPFFVWLVFWIGINVAVITNRRCISNYLYAKTTWEEGLAWFTFLIGVGLLQNCALPVGYEQYTNNILFLPIIVFFVFIYLIPFVIGKQKIGLKIIIVLIILARPEAFQLCRSSAHYEKTIECPIVEKYEIGRNNGTGKSNCIEVVKPDGTVRTLNLRWVEYNTIKSESTVEFDIYKGILGIEEWRLKIEK